LATGLARFWIAAVLVQNVMTDPMSPPPYVRIADALRLRIASGELAPGERLPSTRALAREWNVATATAAHALKTLAHEGVVRSAPRVGTIVVRPRARSSREPHAGERTSELTGARIVAAAIAIADAEGLAAVSLRAVASKLGSPVMSLYRHVKSKDELLALMTDAALGEDPLPATAPPGWRARVEIAARVQWRVLRKHPWLGRVMSLSRPSPLPNAIAHAEWLLAALDGHGLDAAQRMHIHVIVHGFIQGIAVNLETEAEAVGETGMSEDDWMQTQLPAFEALASSGRYPAFAAVLGELDGGFDLDFETLFELGLGALLDGFERVIVRPRGALPKPPRASRR
jgi:DNA-binding transcriptional regulator YhcF (GntR family)